MTIKTRALNYTAFLLFASSLMVSASDHPEKYDLCVLNCDDHEVPRQRGRSLSEANGKKTMMMMMSGGKGVGGMMMGKSGGMGMMKGKKYGEKPEEPEDPCADWGLRGFPCPQQEGFDNFLDYCLATSNVPPELWDAFEPACKTINKCETKCFKETGGVKNLEDIFNDEYFQCFFGGDDNCSCQYAEAGKAALPELLGFSDRDDCNCRDDLADNCSSSLEEYGSDMATAEAVCANAQECNDSCIDQFTIDGANGKDDLCFPFQANTFCYQRGCECSAAIAAQNIAFGTLRCECAPFCAAVYGANETTCEEYCGCANECLPETVDDPEARTECIETNCVPIVM